MCTIGGEMMRAPRGYIVGTVAISLVRAIVDELARTGHDAGPVLERAGIDPSQLDDPYARVDRECCKRLNLLALETTGDAAFGLHMGEHASLAAFSVAGHMVAQCRTIREALDVIIRYYRLVADAAPPSLVEDGDVARFRYEFVRSREPRVDRIRAEFGLTQILYAARQFFGPSIAPLETWFEHEAPDYVAEYQRIFGGTARFGMPHTGFVMPRALLDAQQLYHDRELLRVLKEEADRWLERLGTAPGMAGRIRRLLVEGFPAIRPEMKAVARKLGMSERSLRRRLQSEGVSFQEIAGGAMGEVARALLRDPSKTIQETAYLLDFSDPSSFHRAFKRWTGETPAEYRKAMMR
jgi:AraC-like DNA-binding protein